MNNNLIRYQETIITKIKKFFKNLISRRADKNIIKDVKHKKDFFENIVVRENGIEKRLKKLKQLYDNRRIVEEELSDEDIDKLIEMYDKEIEELTADTERRKENIMQIIKAYKN